MPVVEDAAQEDNVIGITGGDMEIHQVSKDADDAGRSEGPTKDDMAQPEARIGTIGDNLNDVETLANEEMTMEDDVESEDNKQQRQHEGKEEQVGIGSGGAHEQPENPRSRSASAIGRSQTTNLVGPGSDGSLDRPENLGRGNANEIGVGAGGLGAGSDARNDERETGAEDAENKAHADGKRTAREKEDSTEINVESKVDEVIWKFQRKEKSINKSKDDRQGFDSTSSTVMGSDSLTRPIELDREGRDRYGVEKNSTTTETAGSGMESTCDTAFGSHNQRLGETTAGDIVRNGVGKKMNNSRANFKNVGPDQVNPDQVKNAHQMPNLTSTRQGNKRVVKGLNSRTLHAAKGGN